MRAAETGGYANREMALFLPIVFWTDYFSNILTALRYNHATSSSWMD